MNELFENVKQIVGQYLTEENFIKKGKNRFVRKQENFKREEVITFSYVKDKTPESDRIFIEVMSGIYYKDVNSLDKKIVNDFLNSYPIIAGSVGHFKKESNDYISTPIDNSSQIVNVSNLIISSINEGAFNLFDKYSSLKDIIRGIEEKDDWLNNYHKFIKTRRQVKVAAMYLLVYGKNKAIDWYKNNVSLDIKGNLFLEKMIEEW